MPKARVSERVGESTRGGMAPLIRGVRGDLPRENLDFWVPMSAFYMLFGCVLGQNFSHFSCDL